MDGRKNHRVPRFYLKGWCNDAGQIVQLDKTSKRRSIASSRTVLSEKGLHQERDDEIQQLENSVSPIVANIRKLSKLPKNPKDLHLLKRFLLQQKLRQKSAEQLAYEIRSEAFEKIMEELKERGLSQSVEQRVRSSFDQGKIGPLDATSPLRLVSERRQMKRLSVYNIYLCRASFPLLTGDEPTLFGGSSKSRALEIWWPLSPNLAIVLDWESQILQGLGVRIPQTINIPNWLAKSRNRSVYEGCKRFVIVSLERQKTCLKSLQSPNPKEKSRTVLLNWWKTRASQSHRPG